MKVLIISIANDASTDDVIAWLLHYNVLYTRINEDEFIDDVTFQISNESDSNKFHLKTTKGAVFEMNEFVGVWYRRGWLHWGKTINNKYYRRYLDVEFEKLMKFYEVSFTKINYLNLPSEINEKMSNLVHARESGLNIPISLITSSISELEDFYNLHKKIICKPIYFPYFQEYSDKTKELKEWAVPTNLVAQSDITQFRNCGRHKFFPTLFQSYIEKYIEIRVFYIKNQFYPMAIFSQQDKESTIDSRGRQEGVGNRLVPFSLPEEVENSLNKLMSILNLNCGSIDLILTPNLEYYFLEVNPIGQFQWLSSNCNYFLEEKIAQSLTE